MKTYIIKITDKDGYSGESRCKANTKAEAMKAARLYIKQWGLAPATIDYCKEIEE